MEVEENEDEENGDEAGAVEVKEEVEDESEDVIKKYGLDTYDDEGEID